MDPWLEIPYYGDHRIKNVQADVPTNRDLQARLHPDQQEIDRFEIRRA